MVDTISTVRGVLQGPLPPKEEEGLLKNVPASIPILSPALKRFSCPHRTDSVAQEVNLLTRRWQNEKQSSSDNSAQ